MHQKSMNMLCTSIGIGVYIAYIREVHKSVYKYIKSLQFQLKIMCDRNIQKHQITLKFV